MNSERKTKKVGVRALAEATGLSVATVSRVLNNSPLVNPETRRLVEAEMQKTGYVPNSAARALATKRTRIIGAVVPTIDNSIFSRFIHAVEKELAGSGYALILATTDFEVATESRRAFELINMGAEGLILSGASHCPKLLERAKNAGIPLVYSSVHESQDADFAAIGYDNRRLAYTATEYLAGLQHCHLAVIHGSVTNNDRTQQRIQGVRECATALGLTVDFIEQELSVAGGVVGAQHVFAQQTLPDAILCLSDVLALGVMFEAARAGITIPGQLSLMGFDNLDWAELSSPPLTTMHLPTGQMGTLIAQAMVKRLENDEPIASRLLEGRICERRTTNRKIDRREKENADTATGAGMAG